MGNPQQKSPASLIRRGIAQVLRQWEGPPVELALPVAFPILKVVYEVKERLPVDVGLVEKYVREAVTRFGPLPLAEIADLLGLDPALCERVLQELSREGGVLAEHPQGWVAVEHADVQASSLVTHERAFALSGIGGRLLPVDSVPHLERDQLRPTGSGITFENAEGMEIRMKGYFAPIPSETDVTAIQDLLSVPVSETLKLGLPFGIEDILERRPEQEETFFVGATLLRSENEYSIRPWSSPGVDLLSPEVANGDYLGQAGVGLNVGRIQKHPDLGAMEKDLQKILPRAHLRKGPNPHQAFLDHEGEELPIQDICRGGDRQWIGSMLTSGEWWHMQTGSVVSLIPAGPGVTRAVIALGALDDISHHTQSIVKEPKGWLEELTKKVNRNLPDSSGYPAPGLQELIQMLRPVSDSRIQDALDELEDGLSDEED